MLILFTCTSEYVKFIFVSYPFPFQSYYVAHRHKSHILHLHLIPTKKHIPDLGLRSNSEIFLLVYGAFMSNFKQYYEAYNQNYYARYKKLYFLLYLYKNNPIIIKRKRHWRQLNDNDNLISFSFTSSRRNNYIFSPFYQKQPHREYYTKSSENTRD